MQHHVARLFAQQRAAPHAIAQIVIDVVVGAQQQVIDLDAKRFGKRGADLDIDALARRRFPPTTTACSRDRPSRAARRLDCTSCSGRA